MQARGGNHAACHPEDRSVRGQGNGLHASLASVTQSVLPAGECTTLIGKGAKRGQQQSAGPRTQIASAVRLLSACLYTLQVPPFLMCGRFGFVPDAESFQLEFDLPLPVELGPRFNIAPTQPIGIVRESPHTGRREFTFAHWGLIPFWAKDPSLASRLINARSETVADKPSFRAAFKYRRCLVPVSHFYEWQRKGKIRQPYLIRVRSRTTFALAGLWEHWTDATGTEIESCTILTTTPNALLTPIHNRMPVILSPAQYPLWLSADPSARDELQAICQPYTAADMEAFPVSTRVNDARHDGPDLREPL